MTSLSEKALAFSVDHLLGKAEKQTDEKKQANARDIYREELCASMGKEPACCHGNVIEVLDTEERSIRVELCQPDLWEAFHRLGTEMIITKTGRRMFPAVRVRISGLKKAGKYKIHMEFVCVDKHKYRYVYHSSKWMVSGVGETPLSEQRYQHPDSPMTGDYLTSTVVSFEKIKLTNNEKPAAGQISLLSMQKFQPRIVIQDVTSNTKHTFSVTFPQTAFIAVTAYQNQEITRLKIARNPFAKGFREAGKCRSSLEAMMASFGVVINPGNEEAVRKRHVSENGGIMVDSLPTSPKRPYGLWMPSYLHYPNLQNDPQIPYTAHLASTHALYSDIHNSDNILGCKKSDLNTHNSEDRSTREDTNTKPVSPCTTRTGSALSSVHPAFTPWSVYGHSGYLFDQRQLANYYQGLLYNPFANVMYLQSRSQVSPDTISLKCLSEEPSETVTSSE